MFPSIEELERIQQELTNYYIQVLKSQKTDSRYQEILAHFSKNLSELYNIVEDMRNYNSSTARI